MTTDPLSLPLIVDNADKSSALKNRIRKSYRHLRKWGKRTQTNCFRIYDRDIKEYPLAIDFYAGRFCVQYFSSSREHSEPSTALQAEVNAVLFSLFETRSEQIFWRSRIRRSRLEQYEKLGKKKEFFEVVEYGVKFRVNLQDNLDTGLFLDHRETRQLVAQMSKGKRLLNLFAYTGSFSIHAAVAGATSTKSVDLSNTYTQWTRDNLALNQLSLKNNPVIRADCMRFLEEEVKNSACYDIIVIDPPTISRSKKMDQIFAIQKDYLFLINNALKLLDGHGTIIFSTNSRKFVFDAALFPDVAIREISESTIPLDFQKKNIHYCWKLTKNNSDLK